MTTLQKAAHEYACRNHQWLKDALPTLAGQKSFEAGGKWQLENLWHNAPKELPDCEVACVTFRKGFYRINVWNPYYQCWDDSEGDDFEFSGDAELRWMALEVEESK